MIAQRQPPRWSVDAYLDMEQTSPIKHEFHDGHVYAMAGGTRRHSRVAVNLTGLLNTHLRGKPCRTFNSDMKVRIDAHHYVYPDASVSCVPVDIEDEDAVFISAPCLVAEVLSDDLTADYDRGDTFDLLYSTLESLQEYVLVGTTRPGVEIRRRQSAGSWATTQYGPDDQCVLESINARFPVAELYR
jgi:Uma2 family endonuclease